MPRSWSDAQIQQWESKREEKRTAAAAKRAEKARNEREAAVEKGKAIRASNPALDTVATAIEAGESTYAPTMSIVDKALRLGREPTAKQQMLLEKEVRFLNQRKERAARETERKATAKPVPSGRIDIVGKVLAEKLVESDYGSTKKLLIESDDGWRVWVTEPSTMIVKGKTRSSGTMASGAGRGARVRMKATVQPSPDDPTFGFGSRPANYEWLEPAEAAPEQA